jgi:hypothetical protein
MTSILVGAIVLVMLLFGTVIFISFFSEEFLALQNIAEERLNKQKDKVDIRDEEDANIASNSDDVCDLRFTFRGIIHDRDFEFFSADDSFFTDERFIYIDNDQGISNWEILTGQPHLDPVDYTWFCEFTDPLASFSWTQQTSNDLTPLSFALGNEVTAGEVIRFKFFMDSKTNGNRAFDFDGIGLNEPFQGSTTLPIGSEFPIAWQFSVKLEGITNDHYTMDFWNEDYSVNNRNANHHFTENVCRANFATCD